MDKKFAFIINPIAGTKDNRKFYNSLKQKMSSNGMRFHSEQTHAPGHAFQLAKEMIKVPDLQIVSVGGDGTFNEVASAIVNSHNNLAHIPRGSGNGLARMIKIPRKINKISEYLKKGVLHTIDAGKINNHYFFCTCGFGFDALIAKHFNAGKKRGLRNYVKQVLKTFFSYKWTEAEFVLDNEKFKGNYFSVTIANANQYGNNAFIAPKADLNDELLDVTIVRPFPKILFPVMVLALFGKWIHKLPFVETRKVKRVEIHSVSSSYFHCDGDVYTPEFPAQISVCPKALNIVVPGSN